jgi:hypothetical protein
MPWSVQRVSSLGYDREEERREAIHALRMR